MGRPPNHLKDTIKRMGLSVGWKRGSVDLLLPKRNYSEKESLIIPLNNPDDGLLNPAWTLNQRPNESGASTYPLWHTAVIFLFPGNFNDDWKTPFLRYQQDMLHLNCTFNIYYDLFISGEWNCSVLRSRFWYSCLHTLRWHLAQQKTETSSDNWSKIVVTEVEKEK